MVSHTVTLTFDEEKYEVIIFKKTPRCCIKDCDKYATKAMCTLKMCPDHYNQARD